MSLLRLAFFIVLPTFINVTVASALTENEIKACAQNDLKQVEPMRNFKELSQLPPLSSDALQLVRQSDTGKEGQAAARALLATKDCAELTATLRTLVENQFTEYRKSGKATYRALLRFEETRYDNSQAAKAQIEDDAKLWAPQMAKLGFAAVAKTLTSAHRAILMYGLIASEGSMVLSDDPTELSVAGSCFQNYVDPGTELSTISADELEGRIFTQLKRQRLRMIDREQHR